MVAAGWEALWSAAISILMQAKLASTAHCGRFGEAPCATTGYHKGGVAETSQS